MAREVQAGSSQASALWGLIKDDDCNGCSAVLDRWLEYYGLDGEAEADGNSNADSTLTNQALYTVARSELVGVQIAAFSKQSVGTIQLKLDEPPSGESSDLHSC
jgi:hypothetical protein